MNLCQQNSNLNNYLNDVMPQWKNMWEEILNTEKGVEVINFLESKLQKHNQSIYFLPFKSNIFEAFKYFDLSSTKLVLLGQDPYINVEIIDGKETPQAMGLSFSVPNGIKIPPSLKNIFVELKNNYPNFEIPKHGNLIRWVKEENILLLNSALTVKKGISNSHQKKWECLTDKVIEYISENTDNVIFLLLGNNAKSKRKFISEEKHHIITGVHPSPLSAHRGFFNSNIFKQIDNKLEQIGKEKINW